ncbi:hypothetical protein E1267_13605 [Nonomuraea longispora]|uniref:Uncharacterized protein n=1 Tax=Nonomuraea longispora TaxID=1848320 RepID=A0A4R4NIU6_9ACTN|nr:hypothetical protein [Nonomuraea longispora]TDC07367.1 hypothetical protein E1267_13605 [Nonomuraea longispora]
MATTTPAAALLGGLRLVAGHRALRSLLGLAMLSGFHVIPEAIAVPYAASFGLGTPVLLAWNRAVRASPPRT